jgi:hypothetical protein
MPTTITTEKTTDYIFRPVLKTRPKKSFPYSLGPVNSKKDGYLMLDNYWTAKHHMMLDMVVNELLDDFERRTNKGNIYTNHHDDRIKKEAEDITVDELRYFGNRKNYEAYPQGFKDRLQDINFGIITLSEKEIIKKYDFLRRMTSTQIFKVLKEIASTKFKFGFRVKVLTDKKDTFTHYTYYMWAAEPLFSLEDKVLEQTKHNPPRIKLRKYAIAFDGILGRLFAHNVKALNAIRMPVEIYNLSQDAQFIYRRFIGTMVIPKGKEKSVEFKVEYEEVEKYLDMKVDHITNKRNRVARALKELKDAGFIEFKNNRIRKSSYTIYKIVRLK